MTVNRGNDEGLCCDRCRLAGLVAAAPAEPAAPVAAAPVPVTVPVTVQGIRPELTGVPTIEAAGDDGCPLSLCNPDGKAPALPATDARLSMYS